MPLPSIDYLDWAVRYHGRAELELATSGIRPAPAEILGTPEGVEDRATIARFAEALSGWLEVPAAEVVPALGTSQALWLAIVSTTEPGDLVAVESPGYEPFTKVALGLGRRVVPLVRRWESAWAVELAEVDRVLAAGAKLVVLTDLHNPTGVALDETTLAAVAARARAAGARVLLDEVYRFFDPERQPRSTRSLSPSIVAIASLTKVYGLGWARAGWLAGPTDVAERARAALLHAVGVNPPIHAAWGLAALSRLDVLRARADELRGDKQELAAAWIASRDDVEWIPPARGLFGFPRLAGVTDSASFCRTLHARESLLLGPGTFFGAPSHVRLSWGADRDRFLRALDVLGQALSRLPR